MPFTPAHILPVIPIRRWLPFSALAIGTMIPDIPMFFPICKYRDTHSPIGAVTVCAPIGFAIFLLFEFVMRRPLIELMPACFAQRLSLRPNFRHGFPFLISVVVAVIIGACSHQIWDAFRHKGRWGTRLLPMLSSDVSMGSLMVPGYKMVQYGSTLLGLPFMAGLALHWFRRTTAIPSRLPALNVKSRSFAYCLLGLTPVVVGLHALQSLDRHYLLLGATITRSGTIIACGLVTYSLLFHMWIQTRATYEMLWTERARGKHTWPSENRSLRP